MKRKGNESLSALCVPAACPPRTAPRTSSCRAGSGSLILLVGGGTHSASGHEATVKAKVARSCLTLRPCGLYSPRGSLGQNTGVGGLSCLQGSSQPRDRTRVSRIRGDSLPAESPGKPKNTGVCSLSLLQQIFLTQGSNRGLLHCRRIIYQLSYQRSLASKPDQAHTSKSCAAHLYSVFLNGQGSQPNAGPARLRILASHAEPSHLPFLHGMDRV